MFCSAYGDKYLGQREAPLGSPKQTLLYSVCYAHTLIIGTAQKSFSRAARTREAAGLGVPRVVAERVIRARRSQDPGPVIGEKESRAGLPRRGN